METRAPRSAQHAPRARSARARLRRRRGAPRSRRARVGLRLRRDNRMLSARRRAGDAVFEASARSRAPSPLHEERLALASVWPSAQSRGDASSFGLPDFASPSQPVEPWSGYRRRIAYRTSARLGLRLSFARWPSTPPSASQVSASGRRRQFFDKHVLHLHDRVAAAVDLDADDAVAGDVRDLSRRSRRPARH